MQQNDLDNEERPPFFRSWRAVYSLVIGTLVIVIVALYFFTETFK